MKLNIRPDNKTYSVEEKVNIVNGKYSKELKHDNVLKNTIIVNSSSGLSGENITSFTTTINQEKPWQTSINIFTTKYKTVYISYETFGDQVDADDFNYLNEVKLELEDLPDVDFSEIESDIKDLQDSKAEKVHNHKATEVKFEDGDSFQDKLNKGELKGQKGDKGDTGEKGEQGIPGTDATVTKDKIIDELGYVPEDEKHAQSEVERLEKTIKDIVTGEAEDRVRIIPYITDTPIMNELYYKQIEKSPPTTHWYPDDWGIWTVISQNHLQCKASRTYDALTTRISGSKGTVNIKIVKKDKNDRHRLSLRRDGELIYDVRETRGDKEYTLKVKPGDRLTIISLFEGDVYLEYEGEPGDYRLYAYKNGVEERIANAYLVEKELEKYITRDEADSKIGDLDELNTNEKVIVDAINEIDSNKATKKELTDTKNNLQKEINNKASQTSLDEVDKKYKVITDENKNKISVNKENIDKKANITELTKYLRIDGSDNEVTLGKGAMLETNFKNDNWSFINNYTGGGWARGLLNIRDKEGNNYLQIGGNGSGQNFTRLYIGKAWNDWNFSLNPNSGLVEIKGKLTVNDKETATMVHIDNLQKQLDALDIPEGVDLTPVYKEIENLKKTTLKKGGITCAELRGF